MPSVAGDNSSGNVIPTPAPRSRSRVRKKNISKMNFPGRNRVPGGAACELTPRPPSPPPRPSPAFSLLTHAPAPPSPPPPSCIYTQTRPTTYTHARPHTRAPVHTFTCCREILQNFNMIYPARVIYLSPGSRGGARVPSVLKLNWIPSGADAGSGVECRRAEGRGPNGGRAGGRQREASEKTFAGGGFKELNVCGADPSLVRCRAARPLSRRARVGRAYARRIQTYTVRGCVVRVCTPRRVCDVHTICC